MKLQVGVKALIKNNDGRYLLLQRRSPLPDGSGIKWDIPGGRLEPAETLEDGLKRELLEETKLHLTTQQPVLIKAQDIFIADINLHLIRLTYTILFSGSIELSEEHRDHQWATVQEALKLNVDPYLRKVLEDL